MHLALSIPAAARAGIATAALVALLFVAPASAQYFGRNKVHYRTFDFQVLKTDHFDIYYYPEEREGVEIAARLSERWRQRLQRVLRHELTGRQPLVLYASHVDFEQTNTISGELGEGTGGVTEPIRRRIILPMAGALADTDHVIGHELVHAFQFDITNPLQNGPSGSGLARLPLWFVEGMAEYLSLGAVDANTSMWLRDAARGESLPTVEDLNNTRYFPYRWGQAFWAYVAGRWGDDVIAPMLRNAALSGDPKAAILRVLGVTAETLSDDWHQAIRTTYAPILATTVPPAESGQLVIKGRALGGSLNVGPAISPDGRWIAFLSERELFSIDLFVADASSGRILHRLTSTASDPHFSSIQFIYSAGAWDANSRQLAIATVTSGKPALAIFDAIRGRKVRELALTGVDEIFNPTWSPDGQAVAFTGMTGGLTDLFIVEVGTGALRRLTHDAYADLQPAWSPDGRRIAIATDRFSSQFDVLAFGDYRLAVVDPELGTMTEVGGFTGRKNINPQWSPDSRTLYFITDQHGISNLARVSADGGTPTVITNMMTGISGITGTSPAMSVASRVGTTAFSVYDGGKYDIYTRALDAGDTPPGRFPTTDAAQLPPRQRRSSMVQTFLDDATSGLPPLVEYESEDYRTTLAVESLGQPSVAVGANRFGTFVGGGISAYFSDMLGNHVLGTAVQVNSGVSGNFSPKDTAAQTFYVNRSRRWNWGVQGGQIPYVSGGYSQRLGTVNGIPAVVAQTTVFRQTERSAAVLTAYPFNRAQRIEFQAGTTQVLFDEVTRTQAYARDTGQLLADDIATRSLAQPLSLASTSAALVADTSVFGATGPVRGGRYRIEATPTFGALNYTGLLVDYRRYVMPVSFYTLAGRVLHYGRYGTGAQDPRLFPLYLGYPNLVRGYGATTFSASECGGNAGTDCVAIDRLVGSRLLVGNLEWRFPLLRPFTGVSPGMYGPVPIEVTLFADGGVAWNRGERPSFAGGTREPVGSAGLSFRANLFGFAIGEFAFARPFQRRGQGWVFQFNLAPGF